MLDSKAAVKSEKGNPFKQLWCEFSFLPLTDLVVLVVLSVPFWPVQPQDILF